MRHLALGVLTIFVLASAQARESVFRFHLNGEPYGLDPATLSSASGGYLIGNLFRGLYRFDSQLGLTPEGATDCKNVKQTLVCDLNPNIKWSDGTDVLASDYVYAFRRIFQLKSPHTEQLLALKNAREILKGQKPIETLGIRALSPLKLEFTFAARDPEFRYRLALTSLAPVRRKIPSREQAENLITNGPYQITKWERGQRIDLKPNPYYYQAGERPPVQVLFIDDDSIALNLYEKGSLTFLRRLPTSHIEAYHRSKEFYQFPMARFDYLGFGPALEKLPTLRKALSLSLEYPELKKIFHSFGMPGCPSPPDLINEPLPCLKPDLPRAKRLWASLPESVRNKTWTLAFSKLGGEDNQKGMEWVQNQWQKNLGVKIELRSEEQGSFLRLARAKKFDIFRKGVGLDRPTCLAALEIFRSSNPENYMGLNLASYDETLDRLGQSAHRADQKRLCKQAIETLLKEPIIIPLGQIHFTILAKPEFTGWSLNSLNQLDLTHLRASAP